jgi:hypothetical protein
MMPADDERTAAWVARTLDTAAPPDPARLEQVYDLLAPDGDDTCNHPDMMFSHDGHREGHAPEGTARTHRKGTTPGSGAQAMSRRAHTSPGAIGASDAPADPQHRAAAP